MYLVTIVNDEIETEIHSPYTNKIRLLSGSIKKGINTFDSFDFSFLPDNPGAGKLRPLQTLVNVKDTLTGTFVFRGRALIPENSMESDGTFGYSYMCASTLSFLQDSIQDYAKIQDTTVEAFFRHLINVHNTKMSEEHKKFVVGNVTVKNTTDNVYRYVDETQTTWETIKDKLIDRLGGEVQVRYEDGINYIDYLTEIGHLSETTIEVEKNMISFSKKIDPTKVFTVFKPRGARPENTGEISEDYSAAEPRLTISSVNDGKDYLLASQEMIDEFGFKEGSKSYDGITTPSLLKTRGLQFLAEQKAAIVKYTLSAVDLSLLGIDPETYSIGNYHPTKNKYMATNENLRIVGITLDIINPEVSSMTIGDKEKTLSEYQSEANALNQEYKKIQESVNSLVNSNRGLQTQLQSANLQLEKIQQDLINIDVSNLPAELQGISAQILGLQNTIGDIEQAVDGIPLYGPASSTTNGLLISELYMKLVSIQLATTEIDGLLSKEDKNKLNFITATSPVDLNDLATRMTALENK